MTISSIGTPEVTQLVANLSAIYSPELVVGFTSVCTLFIVRGYVDPYVTGVLQ